MIEAPVVGEEATSIDPGLLTALREAPAAWLVDPLDGTANFAAGRAEYAVMAALVWNAETVAAWILQPAEDAVYVAERGAGACRNGARVRRRAASADLTELRGAAPTRFLEPSTKATVEAAAPRFGTLRTGAACAGVEYSRLVNGDQDFALFQRTLPWDHAPGTLLLTEAGGVADHLDGFRYRPAEARPGLLNAADRPCWNTVRSIFQA